MHPSRSWAVPYCQFSGLPKQVALAPSVRLAEAGPPPSSEATTVSNLCYLVRSFRLATDCHTMLRALTKMDENTLPFSHRPHYYYIS